MEVSTHLRTRRVFTKVQALKTGKTLGGIPFTRGPFSYLLRNRFYIGEGVYKGEILPGDQPPILDRDLFNAVQARLIEQQNNHIRTRAKSEAALVGRIFDDCGNRMGPSHTRKKGVRYRYYVSLPLVQGQPDRVGSVHRIPANDVETAVAAAVRRERKAAREVEDRELLNNYVARVDVHFGQLAVTLKTLAATGTNDTHVDRKVLHIPWQKPPSKRRREIIVPPSATSKDTRPIRADARARLTAAIARGRLWLNDLVTGAVTDIEAIAARERCVRKINMTISFAFLAPDLVTAAIQGRLPCGIGFARLCDPPAEWPHQYRKLGLPSS